MISVSRPPCGQFSSYQRCMLGWGESVASHRYTFHGLNIECNVRRLMEHERQWGLKDYDRFFCVHVNGLEEGREREGVGRNVSDGRRHESEGGGKEVVWSGRHAAGEG